MRRNIITTAVFLIGITIYLALLGHIVQNQSVMQREECAQAAKIYADELEKDFGTSLSVTETLAYMIADTGERPQHFEELAKEMLATRPYVASIQLAPQGRVTDIYPEDAAGLGKVDLFSLEDRLGILVYSRDTGVATMQGPFQVTDDYTAIAMRQPVYRENAAGQQEFWGFTIAVLKVPDVFEGTVKSLEATHHAYRISKTSPGQDTYQVILASDDLPEPTEAQVFTYGGCKWKLEVAPAWGWRMPPPLAITLSVGLILVFLLTFLTHALLHLQDRRRYLRQLADTDALTGLNNRQGFDTAVDAYLDKVSKIGAVGVMIDIDDFKRINDLYSHDTGDEALRNLANDLREAFPAPAIVGRNGGDEFCIFLPDCTATEASVLLQRFSARDLTFTYGDQQHAYTISIGYAAYPSQGISRTDLFRCADAALYAVKLHGKHGVRLYAPSVAKEDRSQLAFGLKDIIMHFPGAILIYKATGKEEILFANNELIRLFECQTLEEFQQYTGGTFRGIVHPEEYEAVEQSIWEQVQQPNSDGNDAVRYRIITKSGQVKCILDKGRLVETDVYGKVFYVLMIDESNW